MAHAFPSAFTAVRPAEAFPVQEVCQSSRVVPGVIDAFHYGILKAETPSRAFIIIPAGGKDFRQMPYLRRRHDLLPLFLGGRVKAQRQHKMQSQLNLHL